MSLSRIVRTETLINMEKIPFIACRAVVRTETLINMEKIPFIACRAACS